MRVKISLFRLYIVNTGKQGNRTKFLICLGLAAITFAVYVTTLQNGFTYYDDTLYITENHHVIQGLTQDSIIWAFTQPHANMWHPLTTLSHMLDCQLFGLNASGHHFVSLLIHIVNAMLVFLIFTALTKTTWPSAFIAAVFALHPVQVESVAWAAERKTVLSGLFWFLTISVYIWYTKRPGIGRYILLFLVFGLCIMTKPVVVTLPFALLLLDYWPLGRLNWELGIKPLAPTTKSRPKISVTLLIIEKIPLLLLSALLAVITYLSQQSGEVVSSLDILSLDIRISNASISYIKYIGKLIWPSKLAVIYPYLYVNIKNAAVITCILLFVLATIFCIYNGRRNKYLLVGWLWFVGTLVPMIGLVQAGGQSMANRYMYISILGLLIIVVFAIKEYVADKTSRKIFIAISAAGLLFTLGMLTHMQVKHWQNSFTLFEYTLQVTENNATAENNFGIALVRLGRYNEAVTHLTNAIRIRPLHLKARYNLGKIFLKQGKLNSAIACFDEVIKQNPEHAEAYLNLATIYVQQGRYDLVFSNCAKADKLKLNKVEELNTLAWTLATIGDLSAKNTNKAIEYAQRACELTAYKNMRVLDTLAAAYAASGKFGDAIVTAEKAVSIAKTAGQKEAAREIQSRLELYQKNQPYRPK